MVLVMSKREKDILEQSGLWKAASFLGKIVHKLKRKKLPLEIGQIKQAHRIIFETAKQPWIAGKYRTENGPELKRIDGTILKMTDWHYIPDEMAKLNDELKSYTTNLSRPKTRKAYREVIYTATKLSHRLACIHPFNNGNGRASRLLLNSILNRADLPEIAIKEDKDRYLRAMCSADDGNFELLEEIIKKSLLNTFRNMHKEMIKSRDWAVRKQHHRHKRKR